jgi:hypothetical protein
MSHLDKVGLKSEIHIKIMHICIWSGFCKHQWIPLKFGVQISLGTGSKRNENRVWKIQDGC